MKIKNECSFLLRLAWSLRFPFLSILDTKGSGARTQWPITTNPQRHGV